MLVRLEAQSELTREHDGHCHYHAHDQKQWEVVHRERTDLHPSSRVPLSGDGRTEIHTQGFTPVDHLRIEHENSEHEPGFPVLLQMRRFSHGQTPCLFFSFGSKHLRDSCKVVGYYFIVQ